MTYEVQGSCPYVHNYFHIKCAEVKFKIFALYSKRNLLLWSSRMHEFCDCSIILTKMCTKIYYGSFKKRSATWELYLSPVKLFSYTCTGI